ncbi:hypothetical protein C7S18_12800 [Ahniella affigens]|uniref:Uncharacterized protein n=2 Tax=Ahniella affigens TaxID=2021234 RepID=A0A2P1PT57_9GAMM|nr:hypothetical protein C7S18_12800 [Ahniella affigens]
MALAGEPVNPAATPSESELPAMADESAPSETAGPPATNEPAAAVTAPVADTAAASDRLLAADVLEPSLLSGPGYQIEPAVALSGYMMQFTIKSDYGTWIAESRELVPVRIEEVEALRKLKQAGHDGAAMNAAKSKAYKTYKSLVRIVTRPIDTVKELPNGVERLIKRRVAEVKKAASRARDDVADELADDAPNHPGPFDAGRKPSPELSSKERNIQRGKKQGMRLVKRKVGFKDARTEIALHLGVDPYSDNPVLAAELDRMAWSATGSRKAFSLALGALGAATYGVLPELLRIDDTAWTLDEESLAENNRLRLNALGCDDALSRRLVRKSAFTPTLETAMIVGMEQLQIQSGCDELLELANTAKNQPEARFVVNGIRQLLSAPLPGKSGVPVGSCHLRHLGAGFGAECQGEIYVPVPVDQLSWDDDIAAFLDVETVRTQQRTILLLGTATPEARERLTSRGFAIIENSPLE